MDTGPLVLAQKHRWPRCSIGGVSLGLLQPSAHTEMLSHWWLVVTSGLRVVAEPWGSVVRWWRCVQLCPQASSGPSQFHTPRPGGGWTPGAPSLQGLAGQARGCVAGRGSAAGTVRPVWARSTGIASPQSRVPSMASPPAVPRTSIAAAHGGAGAAGARREGASADTGLWPLPAAGALLLVLCPGSRRVLAALGRCDAASASRRGQVQSAGCRLPPLPSGPQLWKQRGCGRADLERWLSGLG